MYDVSAREAAELFGAHLSGAELPLACVVSGKALPARAQTALASSLRALGYDDAVCFVTLFSHGNAAEALDASVDMPDASGRSADAPNCTTSASGGASDAQVGAWTESHDAPSSSEERLDPQALFLLVEALDPLVIVSADAVATDALSAAYRCPSAHDTTARLLGRSAVTFSSFDSQLDSDSKKQRAWALLKKLPRLN